MPTVWNTDDRVALVRRAESLTRDHTARWGTFSVAGMMAHLNGATQMALGELAVTGKAPSFLRWPPVRYLFIHLLPMPKGAPTAPELLERSASADLAREQETFARLFDRLGHSPRVVDAHPAFGRLSREDWGVLIHKHTDHHLRQFGV